MHHCLQFTYSQHNHKDPNYTHTMQVLIPVVHLILHNILLINTFTLLSLRFLAYAFSKWNSDSSKVNMFFFLFHISVHVCVCYNWKILTIKRFQQLRYQLMPANFQCYCFQPWNEEKYPVKEIIIRGAKLWDTILEESCWFISWWLW